METEDDNKWQLGNIPAVALAAGVILSALSILGFLVIPMSVSPVADMRLEPLSGTVLAGETFNIDVIVESFVPVNVFAGEVKFNSDVAVVQSIDYNTSIADLWTELPWYSNGDGTLNFAGGTTRSGGFSGKDSLITVTFKTLRPGASHIAIKDARILLHDGTGDDAQLEETVNAVFTVEEPVSKRNLISRSVIENKVTVVEKPPTTDLNGDSKQTVVDVSIFMGYMLSGNRKADFNLDGHVNSADFSILLGKE